MNKTILLVVSAVLLFSGCTNNEQLLEAQKRYIESQKKYAEEMKRTDEEQIKALTRTVTLQSTFNEQQAKNQLKIGKNTIKGSALIKTMGGFVFTCAGSTVTLIPYTEYANERMNHIYKNTESGFTPAYDLLYFSFVNPDKRYEKYTKETICDAQGYFDFNNLADGTYFITTKVSWAKGLGHLMKKVTVSNKEIKNIVLAP